MSLEMRNSHRKHVLEAYNVDDIVKKTNENLEKRKKTIIRRRLWTLNSIKFVGNCNIATEEYQRIGKFPRKIWSDVVDDDVFTKEERELLIEVAREFGAFDY